jgi:hemerythrin-like domain-containing protein
MTNSESQQADPIHDFSHCHEGILRKLDQLHALAGLLDPAQRARSLAQQSVDFFKVAIFEHHLDEERELFPAVIGSAKPGEELDHVKAMIKRLTEEHRNLEGIWNRLEGPLKKVAKGQDSDVSLEDLQTLVREYRAHALFEENEFLPLSQAILGRNSNHMAALGLSLHMRHAPKKVNATYI